jgi:hypothetical protein
VIADLAAIVLSRCTAAAAAIIGRTQPKPAPPAPSPAPRRTDPHAAGERLADTGDLGSLAGQLATGCRRHHAGVPGG